MDTLDYIINTLSNEALAAEIAAVRAWDAGKPLLAAQYARQAMIGRGIAQQLASANGAGSGHNVWERTRNTARRAATSARSPYAEAIAHVLSLRESFAIHGVPTLGDAHPAYAVAR